jgi:hypothetical protein
MDWIDLAQNSEQWRALVNTIMNLRVPLNAGKFLSSCTTGGFSRRAHHHEVSAVLRKPRFPAMCHGNVANLSVSCVTYCYATRGLSLAGESAIV